MLSRQFRDWLLTRHPLPPLEGYTFQGFVNPDGTTGTKNILGLTTTVQCVAPTVDYAVRRLKTEVLPTTVFLELSIGNLEAAVAVSLLMVVAAVVVLLIVRLWGMEKSPV